MAVGVPLGQPRPAPGRDSLQQASAPRKPYPPRGRGCSGRKGAPRAAGGTRPSLPPPGPFPASPLRRPEAEPQTQRQRASPSWAPTPGPQRTALLSPGATTVACEPPDPPPAESLAAPLRSVPSKEEHSPRGLTAIPSGRRSRILPPNFRQEAPSRRAHGDARTPAALGVQSPPPGCHRAPGPDRGSPPATAGWNAACGPSRHPPRPANPRSLSARPRRPPLRVLPKLAARPREVPEGKRG